MVPSLISLSFLFVRLKQREQFGIIPFHPDRPAVHVEEAVLGGCFADYLVLAVCHDIFEFQSDAPKFFSKCLDRNLFGETGAQLIMAINKLF